MKRLNLMLVAVAALAILASAVPCLSNDNQFQARPFPARTFGTHPTVGNGSLTVPFYLGWFEGKQAWYILKDGSNDIMINAWIGYKTLYPKLGSAIGNAAQPVYVVLNYQQGPVFSAMPGEADYSALWQIYYVTWKAGATKRPIISDLDLPDAADADIVATDIVVDRPIIATGRLGGPWYPAAPGSYRLKQVIDYDVYDKVVVMPFWFTYAQDRRSMSLATARTLIPDVADAELAALIGANYAPGLATMDPANTQKCWVQDWTVSPYPPPAQYPLLENLPEFDNDNTFELNTNYEFSNIMDFTGFVRTGLPPYVVLKNPAYLQSQIGTGIQLLVPSVRINALVVSYYYGRRQQ